MSNNIINSLKRLERLGQESSRTTEKAKEAARKVARKIFDELNPILIDRAERARENSNIFMKRIYGKLFFVKEDSDPHICFDVDDEMNEYNWIDYSLEKDIDNIHRDVALGFAKAIAEGLIKEIADFIESAGQEAEKAQKILENSKQ